ncbi:hypothetical protein SPHINGO391_210004 [Sphingomonas aurantiaca]|uniref:Uncharacterized protein n=1 Tax=Sphingomonas aurantiaca TaxID=185949 RepID=A0A5E7XTR5_9SPHN|nr:hypothetical protein SPHINGO391_210004 [Sphingomonas aurantiaca]
MIKVKGDDCLQIVRQILLGHTVEGRRLERRLGYGPPQGPVSPVVIIRVNEPRWRLGPSKSVAFR